LPSFDECDDVEILASPLTLSETQHALAVDYGFRDWQSLRHAVEELNTHRGMQDVQIPVAVVERWQSAVDILAKLSGVAAALVMRIRDEDIEVFLSSRTEGNPYSPGHGERLLGSGLYCETVIRTRSRLLVRHAPSDEDWKDNPDIDLGMVSYLGFPLLLPTGEAFGTICVLDRKDNTYSRDVEQLMLNLRALLEAQLEVLANARQMALRIGQLEDSLAEVRNLRTIIPMCMYCKSIRRPDGTWIPIEELLQVIGGSAASHGICPTCMEEKEPEWG